VEKAQNGKGKKTKGRKAARLEAKLNIGRGGQTSREKAKKWGTIRNKK